MKTFLSVIALCVLAVAAHAQGGLKNRSNCALRVTPVCYFPPGSPCVGIACGTPAFVPAGGSLGTLPSCSSCPDGYTGYLP